MIIARDFLKTCGFTIVVSTTERFCVQCGMSITAGQRRWRGAFGMGLHRWSVCLDCVPEPEQ